MSIQSTRDVDPVWMNEATHKRVSNQTTLIRLTTLVEDSFNKYLDECSNKRRS